MLGAFGAFVFDEGVFDAGGFDEPLPFEPLPEPPEPEPLSELPEPLELPLSDFVPDELDESEALSLPDFESLGTSRHRGALGPAPAVVLVEARALKTIPAGWITLATLPPHSGCFFSDSSVNACHISNSSPHLAHS